MRARARRRRGLRNQEVDTLLLGFRGGEIVLQAAVLLRAAGARRIEAQQLRELVAIRRILDQPFLQETAEFIPECRVLFRALVREALEHVEYALREGVAHGRDRVVLLQELPRYIQRKLARIHDTADETQVERQELRGLVGNEHALHVQFHAFR